MRLSTKLVELPSNAENLVVMSEYGRVK